MITNKYFTLLSSLCLIFVFSAPSSVLAGPLDQRARATGVAKAWQSLIASEIQDPSIVVNDGETKRDIRNLRIDGWVRGLGRFRAILKTLRRKSWDPEAEGGSPFILLQGSGRFLSGSQKSEKFPAAATASRSGKRTNISLFLFGDSPRRTRNTALYQFNLTLTEKEGMKVQSIQRAKWETNTESQLFSLDTGPKCMAKHPTGASSQPALHTHQFLPANLQAEATFRELDLVAQMDTEFSSTLGSEAVGTIATMLNAMEVIYENDLGITLSMQIDTNPISIATDDGEQVLEDYRVLSQSISGDLYHLFSGKSTGSLLGIAYLGVVCNAPSFSSGVSYYTDTATTILTVAHEIGHNFNADHDSTTIDPPTIMFPSNSPNVISEFSDISKGQISTHVSNFGSCLDTVDSGGGSGGATPTPSSSPAPTATPGETIDDPSEPSDPGSIAVDLFKTRFRKKIFLVAEAFTEFELQSGVTINIFRKKRRNQEYSFFRSATTDENGLIAVRAKSGFYIAQVDGSEVQSDEVRVRGRKRRRNR